MPNDLMTLDQVGQFATLVFLCWAFTQLVKSPLDALFRRAGVRVPTRYVAFAVAVALYLIVQAFRGPVTWAVLFLAAVNGLVISLTAQKAHENSAQNQSPPAA